MTFFLNYTTAWERFLEWYRGSWADRFFTFLFERVFVVAFGEYEKIPLPANAGSVARNLILSFLVAFWIAAVTMAYVKSVPGGFVRRLFALEAFDEAHAVTLAQAGYRKSAAVRRDLARGGALAKLLCRVGDAERTVAGVAVPVEKDDAAPAEPKEEPAADLPPEPAQPAAAVPPFENRSAETASSAEKTDPVQSESPAEKKEAALDEPKEEPAADLPPEPAQPAAAVPPFENRSAETASSAEKTDPVQSESPAEKKEAAPDEPKEEPAADLPPEPAQPALDFENDRFYIPESLRIRAGLRFARRGSGALSAVLTIVGSTLVAFLLCGLLPLLFRFANFLLGGS